MTNNNLTVRHIRGRLLVNTTIDNRIGYMLSFVTTGITLVILPLRHQPDRTRASNEGLGVTSQTGPYHIATRLRIRQDLILGHQSTKSVNLVGKTQTPIPLRIQRIMITTHITG